MTAQTDCIPLASVATRAKGARIWDRYFKDEPKTWERFALAVFGEPAGFIDAILAGVEILEAHRYGKPLPASEAMIAAARKTTGEVLPRGGDQKSEKRKSIGNLPIDTQTARATQNGISPRTQRKLDRLARDYPPLLEKVQRGELSVHRAAQEAGFVKMATPLDMLKRAWAKASPEEQRQFLAFVQPHTEPERRKRYLRAG